MVYAVQVEESLHQVQRVRRIIMDQEPRESHVTSSNSRVDLIVLWFTSCLGICNMLVNLICHNNLAFCDFANICEQL